MELKVNKFIKDNNLIIKEPVIVAVSGGADSVCLLYLLNKLGYKCVLAHVNHHKRIESEEESIAMQSLAKSLGIPFELLDYYYNSSDNFHNDSHNARYNFFRGLCDKYNTDTIATAHHADDQIETVLIKIMEGSNLYGYGGISTINNDGKYRIIRPLLCTNKNELYSYAKLNNLKYYEDSSNHKDSFLRNRLRHHVIPLLKEECSDLYNKIFEYSNQEKEAFAFIRGLSIDYLNKYNNTIDINSFNKLDIALKKDIISLLLERYSIRKNTNSINDILSILNNSNGSKSLNLSCDYLFIRSYNTAYIKPINQYIIEAKELDMNNDTIFDNRLHFYFSKIEPTNAKYIKLCYNNLVLPFSIRIKQDGDLILTNAGTKKVSRVFIDKKVPKEIRDSIPLIIDGAGKILWIYDYMKSKEVSNDKNNADIYLVCEEKFYA